MKYKIALQQNEEGFSVSVPGLPGCWSQGTTETEALENIQDAIKEYLAARDELLKDSIISLGCLESLVSIIKMLSGLCRRQASESSGRASIS